MNKKTLITLIVVAAIFLLGIAAGVIYLYKGDAGRKSSPASGKVNVNVQFPLLRAVPSDAIAILCMDDTRDCAALLNDGTKAFSALVKDGRRDSCATFVRRLGDAVEGGRLAALRSEPMALSLHYSGSLAPLLLLGMPAAVSDSTDMVQHVRNLANDCGLSNAFYSADGVNMLLVSASETLVNSSLRHQDEGLSIQANKEFNNCLQGTSGKDVLFLSNTYASRLLQGFFQRPVYRHADFFKTVASWTVMSLSSLDEETFSARGFLSSGRSSDTFAGVFAAARMETPGFAKAVPSGTVFALSVPMADQADYLEAYRKYLDACSKLGPNEAAISSLGRSAGRNPNDWAKSLAVKEVAKAQWRSKDDTFEALFVRVGRKDYSLIFKGLDISSEKDYAISAQPYAFGGFASVLFGNFFSLADESTFAFTGEWIVSGSRAAISDYVERYASGDVLQALLNDTASAPAALGRDCSMAAYFSAGAAQGEALFTPAMLSAVSSTLDGAAFEPCFLICNGDRFQLDVVRVPFINRTSTPAVVSDAAIVIPAGPFEVQNSGTGGTNLLDQQSNYYLSFKEKDGKGIWSVPFSGPLCGRVESIDYYANGKIQFLFASGSQLWLLDRLGRFVSGFPAELGKEVLLGPAAYDFTGAKGYTAMVLHTDNTIGMYNLHGVKPDGWKGITSDEKIISLPELVTVDGVKYWAVRTAVQTQIFPFDGGDPVYRQEGAKSIRRDSELEVDGKTLKVTCNDGKTRNIKL
ncbi:MAG: hypothetical protein IKU04_02320 [Bacteroidales bacterium]|nr:hypothetical protein [Bacteroidales bacterium]MBR5072900.1 hypothetical protein [Bacteroidales bacterium]